MRYLKLISSIPLILLGLSGLITTFTTPFALSNLLFTMVFIVPGYLLASSAIKEFKTEKPASTPVNSNTIQPITSSPSEKVAPIPQEKTATQTVTVNPTHEKPMQRYSDDEVLKYVKSLGSFEFPSVDEQGMRVLKILDDVRLSGVTKTYEGINPQDTIDSINPGEEVFFKRVAMKKYPYAVLVVDSNDEPIGWIPEGFAYQEDIAQRLDDGTTVKGRVCNIWGGDEGKNYGISIDIARYQKKRVANNTN